MTPLSFVDSTGVFVTIRGCGGATAAIGGGLVAIEKPVPRDPPRTLLGAQVQAAVRQLVDLANRMPDRNGDGVLIDLVIGATRCVVTVGPQRRPARSVMADLLSPREHEIARMVADGCTNKEIASVLEISSWTVSTHLRRIFSKLDVTTRAAMVARLVDPGVALRPVLRPTD
jgi:DNA-binding CsgD family transcriptional regulator